MKRRNHDASRLFDPIPQCAECLLGLARQAAALACGDDSRLAEQGMGAAARILKGCRGGSLASPQIARLILAEIKRLSGTRDPFADFKRREMARGREVLSRMEGVLGSDLRSRVALAALGNSLDFFKDPDLVFAGAPRRIAEGIPFFRNDVDRLQGFLSGAPGRVLYVADNAGEIHFDLPLYDYVRERAQRTILVVKGGPALNDLTRDDLAAADLGGRFEEVADTGSDAPGVDWDLASGRLRELAASSDLIISKGMANFETIFPRPFPAPVFFLFKVKCGPVGNHLQAPEGSFMAMWRPISPEFQKACSSVCP